MRLKSECIIRSLWKKNVNHLGFAVFDETAPRDNSYIERHTHVAEEGNEGTDMSHSQLQRTHIPKTANHRCGTSLRQKGEF